MTTRYCFALDLKNEPQLIIDYKKYHTPEGVWPEIVDSIKDAGVEALDIYLIGNRLLMIMEVNNNFSFEAKQQADANNPKVVEWEKLMSTFQQKLPWATGNDKWLLMERIFTL